jgi:hypothetical protein
MVVYAITASSTSAGGDSAEIAAATAVFGVPHPPGYPLYTLLTGALVHLLPVEAAIAANLVTGLWGALAVGSLWLLARRLGASTSAAWFAAGSFALGRTWWSQCVAAEVYSLDGLLLTLTLHAALGLGPQSRKPLVLGIIAGLWLGHRPINALYLPSVALVAVASGTLTRPWPRRAVALGLALAGLVFLYLPLASSRNPAIDVGDPSSLDRLWTVVRGAPYGRHWFSSPLVVSASRVGRVLSGLPVELGAAGPLAVAAIWTLGTAPDRRLAKALGAIVLAGAFVCAAYAVLDVAVFCIPALLVLALLGSVGADAVAARIPRGASVAIALSPLVLLAANFSTNDLRHRAIERHVAEDTLASAPVDTLILVDGDSFIHELWYLQAVEELRPDVIVVSPGHVSPWYVEQLQRRYPNEPWPTESPDDAVAYVRTLLDSFQGRRDVYATLSVDLAAYGVGTKGAHLATVPRGLLSRIAPLGTRIDIGELARWTPRFFDSALSRLGPVPEVLEPDEASGLLVYADALSRSAELFARASHPEIARRLYQSLEALRPDDLELIVAEDLKAGLGQLPPDLHLEAEAALSLRRLESPSAPATKP